MVIVMKKSASSVQVEQIKERLLNSGLSVHLSQGTDHTIIGVVGDRQRVDMASLEAMPGVEKVLPVMKPFKLAAREFSPLSTTVKVGKTIFGDGSMPIIAGPCAVEGREPFLRIALTLKELGADMLRGGAFKPRTSPYSFQGLGEDGLKILAEARELTGLPVITEVMDQKSVPLVTEYADVIQVGARNMQNFFLLKELGQVNRPVLLKRGMSATIEEWLMAAEYILDSGNSQVILCERGIRTFETATRNTLDLSSVPLIKQLSHLPVIVDPSHGTGKRALVIPMALAAVACGCDGLIVEVHENPAEAWSDGPQSLLPEQFRVLVKRAEVLKNAMDWQGEAGNNQC
ncbi:MAG: 3-deoxy-7-phosphoheptulonate synthase [Methylocystaceae bacterium]